MWDVERSYTIESSRGAFRRIDLHRGGAAWIGAFTALLLLATLPVAAELGAAPNSIRSVEATPEKVAEGQALFGVCATCHGAQGEGRLGIAPRLNSTTFLAAASDDLLIRTIRDGRPGSTMMSWRAIYQPEQIRSIVSFIRSWRPVPPADLDESRLEGDTRAGAETFRGICSACHGRSGGGYQESASGTAIGRTAFLDEVSNGYLRYLIKHGKSDTQMRPFAASSKVAVANLSDHQIDDVIAFLRSQAW